MIGTKPTGIIIKNGEEYHLLRIMVAHWEVCPHHNVKWH
jgi:hypothetical protein